MKKVFALFIAMMLLVMCSACSDSGDSGSERNTVKGENTDETEQSIEEKDTSAEDNPRHTSVEVGDVIAFGRYEQDNNPENGMESIEWIVLDMQDGRALILSKYGLDVKPYHTNLMIITWKKSTVRSWLNNSFLQTAFSKEEKAAILTTKTDNSASQGDSVYNPKDEDDTQDRIFLLSYAEANRYLGLNHKDYSNIQTRVAPTAYAIAQGAWVGDNQTEDGSAAASWWLRSPGFMEGDAAVVDSSGTPNSFYIGEMDCVVRPALWLNLESGFL